MSVVMIEVKIMVGEGKSNPVNEDDCQLVGVVGIKEVRWERMKRE